MKERFALLILAGMLSACAHGGGTSPRQMEVVAPSRLPPQLKNAALAPPPVPAELDEAGRPLVPEAPQLAQNYYDAANGIDVLDPIMLTDNRAPRGMPTPLPGAMKDTAPRAPQNESPIVLASATRAPTTPSSPAQPVRQQASSGGYGIHLASYREATKARDGWDIYTERFGDLLAPLSPRGAVVDIPEQGEFVRLLAGPFANPDAAQSVCDELAYSDQYCRVMRYEGAPLL